MFFFLTPFDCYFYLAAEFPGNRPWRWDGGTVFVKERAGSSAYFLSLDILG